ncbi:hypothetical protein DEO72_LG6g1356 [Vigna unguiculata]|uniref:Uncharacterized protein n=1 Tax=Vigna unguiculata TaxID=3917 RepID=A0A4D6M5J5_VIGUN|nr:hypothetical protein DEO72_LG6g1356 [Vigna unguiculata]
MHHSRLSKGSSPKLNHQPHLSQPTSLERPCSSGCTTSSRLGELSSPRRALSSLNTQSSSPGRGFNEGKHQISSRPRLGEPFSPKRVYLSLNTPKLLALTRNRAQHIQASSRPCLGEPLSPKRESLSLNTNTSRLSEQHERRTETKSYNSYLGEMDLLGRNLQNQSLFTHTIHQNQYQNTEQSLPTQCNCKNT